jgi:hypothetical protein
MSNTAGEVEWLWTWSGESVGYREGDGLWTHNGGDIGRFHGDEVYGPDGRYLGELIDGERLITAKFRLKAHREIFTPQPPRAKSPRRDRLPGYRIPTGYADFS